MIDSVLKGTGNSRFLKSAVPAGTSWADALAMLQAGTFPIDFNGINTEGFQQVGTPLNKANLLKDATAAQIGLPPSTTPDGMFQALGNTGELHVWRKTVTNKQAGYNLSGVKTNGTLANGSVGYARVDLSYGSSVSVSSDGYVTIKNQTNQQFYAAQSSNWPSLSGKFIKITSYAGDGSGSPSSANSDFQVGTILHIPSGGNIAHNGSGRIYLTKYQIVTGHGAGTTTTYPVSTNPNAYQEGDDAKAAGYTLGDVVSGLFLAGSPAGGIHWQYSDSISVQDNGTLFFDNPSEVLNAGTSTGGKLSSLLGKFAKLTTNGSIPSTNPFYNGTYVYIPADATITAEIQIDRYQPVIGYAAIPAGTTIEYLGKLGDKARVQVVSYVGTGTYGSSNPNSLTFDFVPKIVVIQSPDESTNHESCIALNGSKSVVTYPGRGYDSEFSWNKKTVSWYSPDGYQLNDSGQKYYAVAIG